MAELVVNIIAEQIQKEHIKEDVPESPMQKGVAYKLPQVQLAGPGIKHELIGPTSKKFYFACVWVDVSVVSQEKNKHVYAYKGVICVWCSPRPNTCPDR